MKKAKDLGIFAAKKITELESSEISVFWWVAAFAAVVCVRNFLETWSTGNYGMMASTEHVVTNFVFYHTFLSYLFPFLGLAAIVRIFTGEKASKILNFVLVLSAMIFVAPTVDLVVRALSDHSTPIVYDPVTGITSIKDLLAYWLDFAFFWPYGIFFGGDVNAMRSGQNLGIRVEVNLILAIASSYVFWKTRDAVKTIAAFFVMNAGFMVYVSFPMFLWVLAWAFPSSENARMFPEAIGTGLWPSDLAYLLSVTALSAYLLRSANSKKFDALLSNLRAGRVANVLILYVFWLFLGFQTEGSPFGWTDIFDPMAIAVVALALVLEWACAVGHNDLEDEEGDKLSMSHRPLPSGMVGRGEMASYALLAGAASLYSANLAGHAVFVAVAFKMALHYLYSGRPFRLKAIPLASNFVLSLSYLLTVLAGYLLVFPNGLANFPSWAAALVLVTFTLATPFKDLKDVDGDRKVGVRTIPTLFWLENGKKIVAALWFVAFAWIPFAMPEYASRIWIVSIIGGLAFAWAVTRKNYDERRVFWTYYAYAAICALILILT